MAQTANDPKLSERGARRGTCAEGGEGGGQEAGAVTCGTVRCSAWLGAFTVASFQRPAVVLGRVRADDRARSFG